VTTEPQNRNTFGFEKKDYVGAKSTLCVGCGHDSVTQGIINALFESDIHPFDIVKLSGIGCSSKTTNYFLNQSHGFNSIHGRMAALATGAKIANRSLQVVGISGDGDSASIGLGGLLHLFRRNLPMVYLVENNAVYGLTKGQFSATAELNAKAKVGHDNHFHGLDLCALAITAGCQFVARSFSGDSKQLVPLVQAAMKFNGTAFIDVISPCITYANHEGSMASYDYVRSHKISLQELGFIANASTVTADYAEGDTVTVSLASGSELRLRKLELAYDPGNLPAALARLYEAKLREEILTGLIYLHSDSRSATRALPDALNLPATPLTRLTEEELRPQPGTLTTILRDFR
jgi:2-oxoglutarate/2-oxoacid ferredoxin oxidoreductase subunit beta